MKSLLITAALSIFTVFAVLSPAIAAETATLKDAKQYYTDTMVNQFTKQMPSELNIDKETLRPKISAFTDKMVEIVKEAGVLDEWIAATCDTELRKLEKDFSEGKITGEEMAKKTTEITTTRYAKLTAALQKPEVMQKMQTEIMKVFSDIAQPKTPAVRK